MKTEKKVLPKAQIELMVELTVEEVQPYVERAAEKLSREVKIDGFRPGKAPYEILKQKIGELAIWEEAAQLAINKTIDQVLEKEITEQIVGQPQVNITKLAPGNPLEYKLTLAVLPTVKPGEYKNLKVKEEKAEVTAAEVDKVIEELRETRVKEVLVEREIKEGDKIIIDINMFLDKVPLEGGQGKDAVVVIGKNYLVPGFDKKLLGAKKGEERKFNLPYPEEHYQKNIAGKLVEFEVKIKEIYARELPPLDDQLALSFGLKHPLELKDNIKETLLKEKEEKNKQKAEREIIDKIINRSKFGELPEILINHEAEIMLGELENNILAQGGKFEDYLKSLGKSREQLKLELLPDAEKRVKSALVIREIALVEKIAVSREEVEKKAEEILKQHQGNKEIESRVRSHDYQHYLLNALTNRKVMEKLREWNII